MALSPFDAFQYGAQKRAVDDQHRFDSDQLQRDRTASDMASQMSRSQFDRGWKQARNQVPVGLGRRGMWNSGLRMRREADFGYAKDQALQNMVFDSTNAQRGFVERQAMFDFQRKQALNRLEAERQARRVENAAMMRQIVGR